LEAVLHRESDDGACLTSQSGLSDKTVGGLVSIFRKLTFIPEEYGISGYPSDDSDASWRVGYLIPGKAKNDPLREGPIS
jgi:hypothetical protein